MGGPRVARREALRQPLLDRGPTSAHRLAVDDPLGVPLDQHRGQGRARAQLLGEPPDLRSKGKVVVVVVVVIVAVVIVVMAARVP